MDAPIELERESAVTTETGEDVAERAPPSVRSPIEEASFVVLESGRIAFHICPRVEVDMPTGLEDVQTFSFTLTPRNRDVQRRLFVVKKRLPDPTGRDKQWILVDRVSAPPARARVGSIEIACGTYAIASHRDHVHFLYELDPGNKAVSASLLRQLRVAPRTSYVAAVLRSGKHHASEHGFAFEASDDPAKLRALDPTLLEHEGAEFVLASGEPLRVDLTTTR